MVKDRAFLIHVAASPNGRPTSHATLIDAGQRQNYMAPPRNSTAIFPPLIVAVGVIFCTVIIHALALIGVVHYVRHEQRLGHAGIAFWRDMTIVVGTVLAALVAHLVEIAAWALVFVLCGEFSDYAVAFYHSAVNYTTLGYGDIVMSASWKLLGPLEAADGSLMFGVSTAMIFAVILRLVQTRFRDSEG